MRYLMVLALILAAGAAQAGSKAGLEEKVIALDVRVTDLESVTPLAGVPVPCLLDIDGFLVGHLMSDTAVLVSLGGSTLAKFAFYGDADVTLAGGSYAEVLFTAPDCSGQGYGRSVTTPQVWARAGVVGGQVWTGDSATRQVVNAQSRIRNGGGCEAYVASVWGEEAVSLGAVQDLFPTPYSVELR